MDRSESLYTISLDKNDYKCITRIDLSNNYTDETVPLWNTLNHDDYYGFEIRASRLSNDGVIPTYKCHICSINVPIAYYKEHKDSNRHRTCLKITDIALKRIQLFMTQDNILKAPDTNNYNMYFCTPCATEVPLKEKQNHETTKQHTIAVKHEKVLKDLLTFYINEANSDEYMKAVNDYTPNDVGEVNTDTDTNMDCLSKEITTLNDSRVTVPLNNFHGYFKIGEYIQCRVCKILIEDKHKIVHMHSKEHMDKVTVPIKDVHCIRKNDEIWSHCILCNEIIMDVQFHKLSSSHNDKLNEAVITNTEKAQSSHEINKKVCNIAKVNEATKDCEIFDSNIPKAEFKMREAITNIEKSLTSLEIDKKVSNIAKENKTTEDFNISHSNVTKVELKFREAVLSNTKKSLTGNVLESSTDLQLNVKSNSISESNETVQATPKVNTGNFITVSENSQPKYVSELNYKTTNVEPSKTSALSSDPLVSNINNLTNGFRYYCNICEVFVPNNQYNKREHINGYIHRTREIAASNTVNIKNDKEVQININNDKEVQKNIKNEKEVQININNEKEVQKNIKNEKEIQININNEKEVQKNDNNNLETNTKSFKIHYHFNVKGSRFLFCKVCKIFVKNTFTDMTKHVNSYTHKTNYDKLLAMNTIWRLSCNDKYSCDYCKTEIALNNEIDHINDKQHAASIKNFKCIKEKVTSVR